MQPEKGNHPYDVQEQLEQKESQAEFYPLFLSPDWKTRERESPDRIPTRIHPGSKIHGGDVISGFCRPAYHAGIEGGGNIRSRISRQKAEGNSGNEVIYFVSCHEVRTLCANLG